MTFCSKQSYNLQQQKPISSQANLTVQNVHQFRAPTLKASSNWKVCDNNVTYDESTNKFFSSHASDRLRVSEKSWDG